MDEEYLVMLQEGHDNRQIQESLIMKIKIFKISLSLHAETQKGLTSGEASQIVVIRYFNAKLNLDLENINKIINAPRRSTLQRSIFEVIQKKSSSILSQTVSQLHLMM